MGHIVAVSNQKGGVGKTTTAVNLAASLAVAEKRVLLVDLDPQANATSAFGLDKHMLTEHAYHLILGVCSIDAAIHDTEMPNLTIVPTNTHLVGAELELVAASERESRLATALAEQIDEYDYIIIDCPPSLGLLTVNALTAAHAVLIPLQCEYYALEGMSDLLSTVDLVKANLNRKLAIEGILLTMYDPRNRLTHQVAKEVQDYFGTLVFTTRIPRNVRLSESPSFGKPAILYDVAAKGTQAYLDLATELLATHEEPSQNPSQGDTAPCPTHAKF